MNYFDHEYLSQNNENIQYLLSELDSILDLHYDKVIEGELDSTDNTKSKKIISSQFN